MAGKPAFVVLVRMQNISTFANENIPDYGFRDNFGKKRGH